MVRLVYLELVNGICGFALLTLAVTMKFAIKTPPPYKVDPNNPVKADSLFLAHIYE